MISFRSQNATLGSAMIIAALIIFVGIAVWVSMPLPSKSAAYVKPRSLRSLEQQIDDAKKSADQAKEATAALMWDGTPEQVGPQALSAVTKLAQAHHLKVIAFRPQKAVDVDGLTQLAFSVAVDGTYPDAMQLVKELETKNTKLSVSLVQVAAADAATDRVTGTINLVAYMKTPTIAAPKGGTDVKKS